jgi:2-polyprenyl-6-methoxyphenol hydroxylase-like FAD-dependent oxidoreductase
MASKKAIVVGGSMAGLFAANLLYRGGWEVLVLERSKTPLLGRGAGIVTHQGLLYALSKAGAMIDDGLGVEIHQRLAIDRHGRRLAYREFSQVLTSWSRLLGTLKTALPDSLYRLGEEVVDIEPGDEITPARVVLADGRSLNADLVVAADGLKSMIRRQMGVPFHQTYAGYVAWRAVTNVSALTASSRELMENTFLFSQYPGEQILAYPITSPFSATQIQVNLVWYRRTGRAALDELLTDQEGNLHAEGIPPHRIDPSQTAKMRKDAGQLFHGAWAEHLQQAESIILQPIFDSEVDSMAKGRLALVGDAAFVARPHVGQGVTKAAGDALCLVEALENCDSEAIPRRLWQFSDRRLKVGRMAVNHARRMGAPVMISPLIPDGRYWEQYYSEPENLVRDTAVELEGIVDTIPRHQTV